MTVSSTATLARSDQPVRPVRRSRCGTKEMMQPCRLYLHVISLVAPLENESLVGPGTKEMMQPCLVYLHLISLVAGGRGA